MEAAEELAKGDPIKFPVRDEQLVELAHRGTLPPLKPICPAALQLSITLPPDVDVDDALGVWDFLNVFR